MGIRNCGAVIITYSKLGEDYWQKFDAASGETY